MTITRVAGARRKNDSELLLEIPRAIDYAKMTAAVVQYMFHRISCPGKQKVY